MPKFSPSRGGHAPGHLRQWFESLVVDDVLPAEMTERDLTPRWLTGQLWNCRDVMPKHMCDALDLPEGARRSYAVGARLMRASL